MLIQQSSNQKFLPQMNIEEDAVISIELETGEIFKCKYIENLNFKSFYVTCDEMRDRLFELQGKKAEIELLYQENFWSCHGLIRGVPRAEYSRAGEAIVIEVSSEFKQRPRRSATRLDINLRVQMYEYNRRKHSYCGEFVCDGMTSDVSLTGLCMWSDYYLTVPLDTRYTVSFSLEPGNPYFDFNIPVKLKNKAPNTTVGSYAYDYGFSFDFGDDADMQEKLKEAIFQVKVKGYKG